MSDIQRISAKATSPESRSQAIVVSFGAEWYDKLRARTFRMVIRKRIPTTVAPRWLYFHVNAPKSAICACAQVQGVELIDSAHAISAADTLGLSPTEVRKYIGTDTSIGLYRLGDVSFPRKELATEEIAKHMVYHPPQSFMVLSKEAKKLLDDLCGFDPRFFEQQRAELA